MIAGTESYLRRIHWLKNTRTIPEWERMGIAHGFEGKGYTLPKNGLSLNQVHGDTIHSVHGAADLPREPLEGDGLFSSVPQQLIAVKTADCVPILIASPEGVWALHAGWKGLSGNILGRALTSYRGKMSELHVAIGPCIGLEAFEVGPEVIAGFRTGAFHMNEVEFAFASSKGHSDRWHLDLGMLAALQLQRFEVPPEQVSVVRMCTYRHAEQLHSFRRDASAAGRNWSWIAFKERNVDRRSGW